MPFNDTPEGKTHHYQDGCNPPHTSMEEEVKSIADYLGANRNEMWSEIKRVITTALAQKKKDDN